MMMKAGVFAAVALAAGQVGNMAGYTAAESLPHHSKPTELSPDMMTGKTIIFTNVHARRRDGERWAPVSRPNDVPIAYTFSASGNIGRRGDERTGSIFTYTKIGPSTGVLAIVHGEDADDREVYTMRFATPTSGTADRKRVFPAGEEEFRNIDFIIR